MIHRRWRCKYLNNPLSRETTGPRLFSRAIRLFISPPFALTSPLLSIFPHFSLFRSVFSLFSLRDISQPSRRAFRDSPRIRTRRARGSRKSRGYRAGLDSIEHPLAIREILDIRHPGETMEVRIGFALHYRADFVRGAARIIGECWMTLSFYGYSSDFEILAVETNSR